MTPLTPSEARPRLRILLIDDDRAHRAAVRRILSGEFGPTDVDPIRDRADLARRLRHVRVDAVISDLVDGWGDSLLLIRESKAVASDVPFIIFTGRGSESVAVAAMKAGADDYVVDDPAGRARLGTAIRAATEAARQQAQARAILRASRAEGSSVSSLLLSLSRRTTPELTAADVCEVIREAADPASVTVLAFEGPQRVVPLAFVRARQTGPPLPAHDEASARHLQDRARDGAWITEGADGATIHVPLGTRDRSYGLLVVTTDGHGDAPREPLPMVLEVAVVAQALLIDELVARADRAAIRRSVARVVAERSFVPVYQPIVDLATDEVVGYEALTRFADGSDPEHRFQEARRASASLELELATIDVAIGAAALLPLGRWLDLNVSPEVLLATDELRPRLAQARQRVVLEIARGERFDDYAAVRAAVDRLGAGVDLAVGEGGDGSSSLSRIVELAPDFLKLDMSLIRRVDTDPARQALVAGLVHFSGLVGCRLIAEGVASEAERRALRTLGVRLGQGNLLGRPASALRHTQTIDARARQASARQAGPRRGRPAPPADVEASRR
jgi:EAL domain-containing protein (putative c-di-GMP-specific phosphodiesterase class I)/DNA-binding NarL/FixJ family response regulator